MNDPSSGDDLTATGCPDHPPGMAGPLCKWADLGHFGSNCRHWSCWAISPCPADRLSEDDIRWLAAMTRRIHARHIARLAREREREDRPADDYIDAIARLWPELTPGQLDRIRRRAEAAPPLSDETRRQLRELLEPYLETEDR